MNRNRLLCCVCVVCFAGCGEERLKLVPVEGRVLVDDRPLTDFAPQTGFVEFRPYDTPPGTIPERRSAGVIHEDGTYSLQTQGQPGAPVGRYKVIVLASAEPPNLRTPRNLEEAEQRLVVRRVIDEKYADIETTDLEIEVSENPAPNAYDLNVTR